jgi:misacylated tRNA(Ala) deacylase
MMTKELFRTNSYINECDATVTAITDEGIILDQTVFYPMGGGQPGDIGKIIIGSDEEIAVTDTRYNDDKSGIVHFIPSTSGINIGDKITASIDWDRRYKLMQIHTSLHLLSTVVPLGVTGGRIDVGKGHLDFRSSDYEYDKEQITEDINKLIQENLPVEYSFVDASELQTNPELVKTMSVAPPTTASGEVRLVKIGDADLQSCGGTHMKCTGDIQPIVVTKIKSKGKENKRVQIAFAEG